MVLSLLLLVPLASIVTAVPRPGIVSASQQIQRNAPGFPTVDNSSVQAPAWINCSATNGNPLPPTSALTCGTLKVPLDYGKPLGDGNELQLGFSIAKANATSKGSLFFNPGGPGAASQGFALATATLRSKMPLKNLFDAELFYGLDGFDLIMLDPRGTGASSPVNCSEDAYDASQDGIDDFLSYRNESAFSALSEANVAYAKSCQPLSQEGLLDHVGTQEAVNDWESLRIALHIPKVSLLGISYGTYYFSEYAARYPDSIEKAVLDGVLPHGASDKDLIAADVKTGEWLLERADIWCQLNNTCPYYHNGSVVDAWNKHVATIPQTDVAGFVNSVGLRLGGGAPYYGIATKELAGTYDGLSRRDQRRSSLASNSLASADLDFIDPDLDFSPIYCSDQPIEDPTFEGFMNLIQSQNTTTQMVLQSGNIRNKLGCVGWPFNVRPPTTISIDIPLMWVTADGDKNTATDLATFAFTQTSSKAFLIDRHGDGHGTIDSIATNGFFQPAQQIEIDYLNSGNLPQVISSDLVTVIPPGGKRDAIKHPKDVPIGLKGKDIDEVPGDEKLEASKKDMPKGKRQSRNTRKHSSYV